MISFSRLLLFRWGLYTIQRMNIIEIIFPVFAIAFIGYLLALKGVFSVGDINGLSRFVFMLAIPTLLFNSLAKLELPPQLNWQFLLSYYLALFVVFGLGMWLGRKRFGLLIQEQGVFGMGSSYSNLILVGLPIISAGLGEEAILPLLILVSIHSAIQFFMVSVIAERGLGNGRSPRSLALQTIKNLASNPIIIGLVLGLIFNFFAIPIPAVIDTTIEIISRAALPTALVVLGASLATYKIAGHLGEVWTIVGLKMVVQPLLVGVLAFFVFDLDPLWGAVAVMAAGMPVGINAYMMAQKYQVCLESMSTAVLLSSILAIFSQSVLLAIFMHIFF